VFNEINYLVMKHYFTIAILSIFSSVVYSNTPTDSLVYFSNLIFQSEFEKQAFKSSRQENEFNLCLASDKNMTAEKAIAFKASFDEIFKQLEGEKLTAKNLRQKFKNTHKIIFNKSHMQYSDNADFSDILNNGNFNYVTASVLYSMILKKLNIPSYYLFTGTKVDIIVNPNNDQIILETLTQKDENGYFNSSDNKGYIVNVLDKNIRIGSEYLYNASQTNSVVRFKDSDLLKTNQLAATIYYYNAFKELKLQNNDAAYQLMSKACYLYPNETFINTMYAILYARLQACTFDKVEDVDLLGQLSKFKNNSFDYIKMTFWNILGKRVSNQNNNIAFHFDLPFCTAAYNRLLPQINDVLLADEISYMYYLALAYCPNYGKVNLEPALQALKLKPNDKPALTLLESNLHRLMDFTDDKVALLDTLNHYEVELSSPEAINMLKNTKLLLDLDIAKKYFECNKINEGLQYISQFESVFKLPLPNISFKISIENTYYEYARYYVRFNNNTIAQKIVNKGLEYVPKSNMIESATYKMQKSKPVITKRNMTKAEYEKYMKKKAIE